MSEGFDDIEMRNRNMEEEEEESEGETSFGGDDPENHNRSVNIINTENPKSKFNRVGRRQIGSVPDIKKDIGSMRRSMTSDRKKSFKKIFDVTLVQIQVYCQITLFVRENENIFIVFKGKKIGNVDNNLEPELFVRKNKKYVNKFNENMKKLQDQQQKDKLVMLMMKI